MNDQRRLTQELRDCETRLRRNPASTDLRFRRAKLLDASGRSEHAIAAYMDVLERDKTHFGALNDLGLLLYKAGNRKEARTCYEAAVAYHPGNAVAHANLGFMLMKFGEPSAAREHYEKAVALDPSNTEAHRGLAATLATLGETDEARVHQEIGFKNRFITTLPFRGAGNPIRLLLLVSTGSGNLHSDRFIDDRVFLTHKLIVEYADPAVPLPDHDLVFNGVGDADAAAEALEKAAVLLERTAAPVINRPRAVLATTRLENARRLGELPDVRTAQTMLIPRGTLTANDGAAYLAAQGYSFPLLLRSPGFHTGQHFERIEGPAELTSVAQRLPGDAALAMEFLDARGADGAFRKYRAMIVDGTFFPLHLAIGSQWKIHYFSADMADRADYRAEDAAFLADMPRAIGPLALAALERVRETLDLDYAGIDFALDAEGRVLVFEANATMVVNPPDPDERWAYRRAPTNRVIEAVRAMLLDRAKNMSYP